MNPDCPRCGAGCSIRFGRYRRADDAQFIQRFRCKACGACHSSATTAPTCGQKRRRLNRLIEVDIACSTSQRRIAKKLGCARQTVARKIAYLAAQARLKHAAWLDAHGLFEHVQWDELISFEHSRLKPLAVAVLCAFEHRFIIGFGVATIPASGPSAERAREKYGHRPDRSASMRKRVLSTAAEHLHQDVVIDSDEHTRYPGEIRKTLPGATHRTFRSVRGALTGQGELKRTGHDPLHWINHTLAMMRDDIKRFARRTWCTTKKVSALEDVIAIYLHYRNTELITPKAPKGEPTEGDIR